MKLTRAKFILPALTEATSPFWRPIKYSLFPPLGLATLAAYLDPDLEISLQDEHVEKLDLNDEPDLVIIQVYITNAYRAYAIADHYRRKGCYVVLGGLHVTSLPEEALPHADSVFLGPGEETFPQFLRDFAVGQPQKSYASSVRTLDRLPPIRRDLIKRSLYLVPNSIVVTRGCPHHCEFCYKDAFFAGGKSFYAQRVDDALAEIERLPGRHRAGGKRPVLRPLHLRVEVAVDQVVVGAAGAAHGDGATHGVAGKDGALRDDRFECSQIANETCGTRFRAGCESGSR
jgi:radical SAM superfamily enzyme YgiQ (UPF0313 family)